MIKRAIFVLTVALIGVTANYGAWAQPSENSTQTKPEVVGAATVVTLHGKIVAVNKSDKVVTVEGPAGRKVSLKVENPYNLQAAKVGEPVVARFYEVVTVRKKKPGEVLPSASLQQGIATAQPGEVPGAVAASKLSLVVTVVSIDSAHGAVTIKAPDGTVEKVKARNPQNLKLIKPGDQLVVTLSRAVAVSLEKKAGS